MFLNERTLHEKNISKNNHSMHQLRHHTNPRHYVLKPYTDTYRTHTHISLKLYFCLNRCINTTYFVIKIPTQ